MKLYIANCSKQNQEFVYRVIETSGARVQQIPIGGQVQLTGELSAPQIDSIVRHHATYGLLRHDEIDRSREFVGLVYCVDRPVTAAMIERVNRHNTNILEARGKVIRQNTAVAQNQQLETSLLEADRQETLKAMDVTIVEEKPDPRSETAPIAEGIRVSRNEAESPPPKGARKVSRGRKAA